MSIRVLVVDDQALVRAGLRKIFDADPALEIVGEAAHGAAAVDEVRRCRPDVVVMDIRMPVLDGLEATRRLTAQGTGERILILTTFDLDEYVYEALRAGASGFMLKDAPPEELIAAVRAVAAGEGLLAPAVTKRVIERFVALPEPDARSAAGLDDLTAREREVLGLLARGLANAEIAAELVISDGTAKTHVARILGKLGLRDRVQAVILAYECGLVRPGALAAERQSVPGEPESPEPIV
jgi:DNA-binding NarL/FixJ family response regulator